MTKAIKSISSDQTEEVARKIGSRLKGGEVIDLVSDLGGGKTTFVHGLANGAGSQDNVSSPTFTISNIYKTKGLQIYHFDFYRLHEAGLMQYELEEAMQDKTGVIVIEWSDVVSHVLPTGRLTIKIDHAGDDKRTIIFNYSKDLDYLMEGL